jgi:hypothetical protein
MAPRLPLLRALVIGAVSAIVRVVFADEAVLDLVWDAPSGCPTGKSVEAEVKKLLPKMPSTHQRWNAHAHIERQAPTEWSLHLEMDASGLRDARDFRGSSCEELAATAAVVLAIAVDPSHDAPTVAAPPPQPPPPPPPVPQLPPPPIASPPAQGEPPPPPVPASRPVAIRPRRDSPRSPLVSFAAYSDVIGSVGILATPSFGADVGIAWLRPEARVALGALWLPSTEIPGPRSTGGSLALIGGTLSGCWWPLPAPRFGIGPCLGAQLATISAQATGSASGSRSSLWGAGTAGGLFLWHPTRHLAARATLDLVVPFVRETFYIQEVTSKNDLSVHTQSVGAQAGIGAETTFP